MAWWHFGRQRKKDKREKSAVNDTVVGERRESRGRNKLVKSPPPSQRATKPFFDRQQVLSPHPQAYDEKAYAAASSPPMSSPLKQFSRQERTQEVTALPPGKDFESSPHLRIAPGHESNRTVTMRSKLMTNDQSLLMRKSSKRRKDDDAREDAIRSMASPTPTPRRSGVDSGGILRRDSKRLRTGLNRNLQNPESNVSLPTAESLRSSLTSTPDHNRFVVGMMSILSPRPTIRYSFQEQHASSALHSNAPSRTGSRRDKRPASRRTVEESKKIDGLADDLNAENLRDLMDRDQRRRERRRKAEEDRARRRLERHAERSEVAKSIARALSRRKDRGERPVHPLERAGAFESNDAGPSVPAMPRIPSEPIGQPALSAPDEYMPIDPFVDPACDRGSIQSEKSLRTGLLTPPEQPAVGSASEVRYSQTSMSPPHSPLIARHSSQAYDLRSQSMQDVSSVNTGTDSERRGSETSSRRGVPLPASLTSFFRRTVPGKRGSTDRGRSVPYEASFSNTSRESVSRQVPPAHLQEKPSQSRARSGTPVRTKSKFREDLPELPVSPPASRLQSPEPETVEATFLSARRREKLPQSAQVLSDELLQRAEAHNETIASNPSPSIEPVLSQSLASVDSEASWISGRPLKRTSQQRLSPDPIREQVEDEPVVHQAQMVTAEEYFRRSSSMRIPGRADLSSIRAALATDDDSDQASPGQAEPNEDPENFRSGEVARVPTVVHRQARVTSHEGLLNQYQSGTGSAQRAIAPSEEAEDYGDPSTPPEGLLGDAMQDHSPSEERRYAGVQHMRSISKGSAVLLDIPARRNSQMSRSVSPQPPETTN